MRKTGRFFRLFITLCFGFLYITLLFYLYSRDEVSVVISGLSPYHRKGVTGELDGMLEGGCSQGEAHLSEESVKSQLERNRQLLKQKERQ